MGGTAIKGVNGGEEMNVKKILVFSFDTCNFQDYWEKNQ